MRIPHGTSAGTTFVRIDIERAPSTLATHIKKLHIAKVCRLLPFASHAFCLGCLQSVCRRDAGLSLPSVVALCHAPGADSGVLRARRSTGVLPLGPCLWYRGYFWVGKWAGERGAATAV